MVSKNQMKLVKSLQQKKYRNQHGLFVVEGIKLVRELLYSDYKPYRLFTTDVSVFDVQDGSVDAVTDAELRKMSGLTTPNTVVGVFEIPKVGKIDFSDWILAVDDVRDPGNLGTIIRLCDWFGIEHLICSENTVDCYNPKTLQATMGSIARVQVGYTVLEDFLRKTDFPVFGAFMEGRAVYEVELPEKGILVMGNEANGISSEVQALVSEKICIPKPAYPKTRFGKNSAESLNVATATAILLNEIRRNCEK